MQKMHPDKEIIPISLFLFQDLDVACPQKNLAQDPFMKSSFQQ